MEKYCLTDNTIYITGNRLYQIKALKDFGKVKKGDLLNYGIPHPKHPKPRQQSYAD